MKIYRDRDGDLWSIDQGDRVFLACRPDFVWEGPTQRDWARLVDDEEEGPLVELEAWATAEHMPGLLELLDRLAPAVVCDCGNPARGWVPADDVCPAHVCLQCSRKHCKIRAHVVEHGSL